MNKNGSNSNLRNISKVNIAHEYKDENNNKEYKSNAYLYRCMRSIKIKIDKKVGKHELRNKFIVSLIFYLKYS